MNVFFRIKDVRMGEARERRSAAITTSKDKGDDMLSKNKTSRLKDSALALVICACAWTVSSGAQEPQQGSGNPWGEVPSASPQAPNFPDRPYGQSGPVGPIGQGPQFPQPAPAYPGYDQTPQEWPGYESVWSQCGAIYHKLMMAKRSANIAGSRGQFDTAAKILYGAMNEIKTLAQWNYNRPAPHTIAAAQAAMGVTKAALEATIALGPELGPKVRFIAINEFFKTIDWAYQVDTHYYQMVAMNPYGDFPMSYHVEMQRLGKLFLEYQTNVGPYLAANKTELAISMAVSRAVRYILAVSVFRRSLEQVGYELLYIEQICLEALASPYSDPYVVNEIRSRMSYAAGLISECVYVPQPNYPRPPHGRDYGYGRNYGFSSDGFGAPPPRYPGYGSGSSDGFGN